ncbi:MAG: hypothetical protein EOM37_13435 [Proteobacteria bacterium]|nr:hypothetical protein [Pseudomonadota bacterium]
MASIWISRPDLEDLIGHEAALALLTAFPGRSVYIPSKRNLNKLVPIVGPVANEILCYEFGGCEIILPTAATKPPTLKDRILERLEQGRTYGEIVTELQCSQRHVQVVAADSGMTPAARAQKARREAERKA